MNIEALNKTKELEQFAAWKGYPLPDLNADGQFPNDALHREWVAFRAGLARSLSSVGAAGAVLPEAQRGEDLSFEQIEDAFPETGSCTAADGSLQVSAQWMHDFARNIWALRTRQNRAKEACSSNSEQSDDQRSLLLISEAKDAPAPATANKEDA